MEALSKLPYSVVDLICSYDQRIRFIFNQRNMLDYLSGDEEQKAFCILTDRQLYIYDNEDRTIVADVERINGTSLSTYKEFDISVFDIIGIVVLLAITMALVSFLVGTFSGGLSGLPPFYALAIVFFTLIAIMALIGIGIIVKHILTKKVKFNLEIIFDTGMISTVEICSTGTDTRMLNDFKAAIKAAQAANRAEEPDVFYM